MWLENIAMKLGGQEISKMIDEGHYNHDVIVLRRNSIRCVYG